MPGQDGAPGASRAGELRTFAEAKAEKLPEGLASRFLDEVLPVLTDVVRAGDAGPVTVDDFIAAGRRITGAWPSDTGKLYPALLTKLGEEVGFGRAAKVENKGNTE